jgi:transketolase
VGSVITKYNLLDKEGLEALRSSEPDRFQYKAEGGAYLNLKGLPLEPLAEIDPQRIASLARVMRGLEFAAVDAAKSGHPGGSSSKTEALLTMLTSGVVAFDAMDPKHPGRDRIVWSAGHCTPLAHSLVALVYEALRRKGMSPKGRANRAVIYPEDLTRFRKYHGPSGHVESFYALADTSTGSSGHGISASVGFAILHRSCGLDTRVFVIAGDAETEEGMTYEARNIAANLGMENLVVTLDFNGFGIDGPITEVLPSPYMNHWFAAGWNMIEVDGHDPLELGYAYRIAARGFDNGRPTVIIAHCIKGKHYGRLEQTSDSHGTPLPHAEYVEVMKKLGFDIPGREGDALADIQTVLAGLAPADVDYLIARLDAAKAKLTPEPKLVGKMSAALAGRAMADYTTMKRPDVLPPELVFEEGTAVPTRKATEAWFAWAMKNTAFFYLGAGDLMKSILTGKAEQVYGVFNRDNPLGRGIRFGIAEQNMAMMSTALAQDILPGGFRPMSAFTSYGVFTPMMANAVRMTLINNDVNPDQRAFFILLAAHDGPETGEDGPTHHGLFWMSLFNAYPGIKVYKPLDANETIEMLFYAVQRGEPIALSVVRPPVPVLQRGNGIPPASEAINGAYVFKQYTGNGKRKLVLAVAGGQVMVNVLKVLPDIEQRADVKIVAVTSPELFEELRARDPEKANSILSDDERQYVIALHNGWRGFLYPFLMPGDYTRRAFGIDNFSRSGSPAEIYENMGFHPAGLREKILSYVE